MKGIDFEVAAGEAFGLLGPNGAGKSTTIGMLTTTVAPTSGSARVAGSDVAADPLAARRASGIVFQDSAVDRALTGRRNLDIHARLWGVEQRATPTTHRRARRRARPLRAPGARRRDLQRRRAPPARDRARPRLGPAGAVPGRADGRARPAHPPRAARGHRPPASAPRDDDPAHDALPRRGRAAVRQGRDHPRRADHRTRHARGSRRGARRRARRGPGEQRPGRRAGLAARAGHRRSRRLHGRRNADRARCTVAARPRRSIASTTRASASAPSPHEPPRSTTSTCS